MAFNKPATAKVGKSDGLKMLRSNLKNTKTGSAVSNVIWKTSDARAGKSPTPAFVAMPCITT